MACSGSQYRPSSYVRHLHDLPRLDFRFNTQSNGTFEPTEIFYWEGVGFWGAIFVVFGLLLFFGTLFYLICKFCCCRTQRRYTFLHPKYGKTRCYFLLVAAVAMTIIGVAVYGAAASVADGETVVEKGRQGQKIVSQVQNEVTGLLGTLEVGVNHPLLQLQAQSDIEQIQEILDNLSNVMDELITVSAKIGDIRIGSAVNFTEEYINYWEYGSLPAVSWMVLVALIFVIGSCCCTGCMFQLAVVLALISIIVAFITGAVAFCLAVAGSDFCINPDHFVLSYSADLGPKGSVEYYVCCSAEYESPFKEEIENAFKVSEQIESLLIELKDQVGNVSQVELVNKAISGLNRGTAYLHEIAPALLNCQGLHELYVGARSSICDNGILTLIVLCGAAMAMSVMFVILIACGCGVLTKLKELQEFEQLGTERVPLRGSVTENGSIPGHGENRAVEDTREDSPPTYETFRRDDGNQDH